MADRLLELYEKMPKGYFRDEEEFKAYASDPANYDDIFDIIKDSGEFASKEEMLSYIAPDLKKKERKTLKSSFLKNKAIFQAIIMANSFLAKWQRLSLTVSAIAFYIFSKPKFHSGLQFLRSLHLLNKLQQYIRL